MADAALLFHCGMISEPTPVEKAFSGVGVHREVADLERSEVLEEVAALRGGHAKVAEAGFHDGARSGNFVPLDRYAQPGIVRSPAPHSDQQIRAAFRV